MSLSKEREELKLLLEGKKKKDVPVTKQQSGVSRLRIPSVFQSRSSENLSKVQSSLDSSLSKSTSDLKPSPFKVPNPVSFGQSVYDVPRKISNLDDRTPKLYIPKTLKEETTSYLMNLPLKTHNEGSLYDIPRSLSMKMDRPSLVNESSILKQKSELDLYDIPACPAKKISIEERLLKDQKPIPAQRKLSHSPPESSPSSSHAPVLVGYIRKQSNKESVSTKSSNLQSPSCSNASSTMYFDFSRQSSSTATSPDPLSPSMLEELVKIPNLDRAGSRAAIYAKEKIELAKKAAAEKTEDSKFEDDGYMFMRSKLHKPRRHPLEELDLIEYCKLENMQKVNEHYYKFEEKTRSPKREEEKTESVVNNEASTSFSEDVIYENIEVLREYYDASNRFEMGPVNKPPLPNWRFNKE